MFSIVCLHCTSKHGVFGRMECHVSERSDFEVKEHEATWQTNDLIQTATRRHYCGAHPQGHFQEPHAWNQNYKVLQYVWSLSTLWYHRQRFGWIRNNQTISIFVATELLQARQLWQSLVNSLVWHLGPRALCLMISFSSLIASFDWSYYDTATLTGVWDIVWRESIFYRNIFTVLL